MKLKKISAVFVSTFLVLISACEQKSIAIPSDAVGTVNTVVKSIANYQPQAVWQALPASYQNDVNRLLKLSSSLIDKDNYDKMFSVMKRINVALVKKKDLFLSFAKKNIPPGRSPVPADKIYDLMLTIQSEVNKSDIASHAGFARLNVNKFLSSHGSRIMRSAVNMDPKAKAEFDKISNVSAKKISGSGDEAKLELTAPNGKKETVSFVRIEGRWIPKSLQRYWKIMVVNAETRLKQMQAQSKDVNAKLRLMMPMFEMAAVQIENIKSEKDLMNLQRMFMTNAMRRRK